MPAEDRSLVKLKNDLQNIQKEIETKEKEWQETLYNSKELAHKYFNKVEDFINEISKLLPKDTWSTTVVYKYDKYIYFSYLPIKPITDKQAIKIREILKNGYKEKYGFYDIGVFLYGSLIDKKLAITVGFKD